MSNCLWCNEERVSSRRLEPGQPRECPSCGQVWLITGEGKPRAFFLRSCFMVDQVVAGTEHGFKTKLLGKDCRTFDPMVSLSDQDWFEEFKRTQSNFSFGLQAITDHDFILGFEKLADRGKT